MGEFGEVTTEGLESRGFTFLTAGIARIFEFAVVVLGAVAREIRVQLAEDLVAGAFDVHLEVFEDTGGDAVTFAEEAEEDVLGPDVAVIERFGLFAGEGEDLFDPGSVGDVAHHFGLRTIPDLLLDFEAHGLEIQIHLLEDIDGNALSQFDEAEEEVLRPDVVVIKPVRLFSGEGEDLLSSGGKVIHRRCPFRSI